MFVFFLYFIFCFILLYIFEGWFLLQVEKGLKKMCKFLSKKAVSLTQAEHRSLLVLTHCVLSGIHRVGQCWFRSLYSVCVFVSVCVVCACVWGWGGCVCLHIEGFQPEWFISPIYHA